MNIQNIEYLPININKLNNLLIEKKIKNIKIIDLINTIDDRFCIYEKKKGSKSLCLNKPKMKTDNFCKKHFFNETNKNKRVRKKDKKDIYKCIGKNKYGNSCKRNVLKNNSLCKYHQPSKSILNEMSFHQDNKMNVINIPEEKRNKIFIDPKDLKRYRNLDCIEYLKINNFQILHLSKNYIRIKEKKYNFVIYSNMYYDNYSLNSGNGLLNLIMFMYKYDIHQAIEHINFYMKKNNILFSFSSGNNKNYISNEMTKLNKKKVIRKYNQLPLESNNNIIYIKDYLIKKRKIDEDIVNDYINQKLISADKRKNCLFYNKDKSFVSIKGTVNNFVSCAGIPDFIVYGNNYNNVYLFESPIDCLSYFSLNKNVDGVLISTNGSMMMNKIINYLIENKTKLIYICFDNDEQGDIFYKNLVEKINIKNIKIIYNRKLSKLKDFNDDLVSQ